MELRLTESNSTFEDYNEKLVLLAAMKNRHMFLEFKDIPEVEAKAEISRLENLLEEMSH
jgi:hypothetical protein